MTLRLVGSGLDIGDWARIGCAVRWGSPPSVDPETRI